MGPRPSYLKLLRGLQERLQAAGKPAMEARWILQHAAGLDGGQLATRLAQGVPLDVEEAAWAMLKLRLGGYPLQLLLGETEFFGLRLEVQRGVLIPRPETEGLVERALGYLPPQAEAQVLDVGTGSGAIALALKAQRPLAQVWASEISPNALELARRNAQRLGLEVTFLPAALTAGLKGLDLIVSNPPYLPEGYRAVAPPELAYEDPQALYAGPEGLDVARPLLEEAWWALRPGGWLLLELAPENVHTLAKEALLRDWQGVRIFPDLAQRPRYLAAQKPHEAPEDATLLLLREEG